MTAGVSQETKTALISDAQNRAWRTLLQGAAVDVLAAVSMAAYTLLSSTDTVFSWSLLGALAAKSAGVALTSYLMRRFVPVAVPPEPEPVIVEVPVPVEVWVGPLDDPNPGPYAS